MGVEIWNPVSGTQYLVSEHGVHPRPDHARIFPSEQSALDYKREMGLYSSYEPVRLDVAEEWVLFNAPFFAASASENTLVESAALVFPTEERAIFFAKKNLLFGWTPQRRSEHTDKSAAFEGVSVKLDHTEHKCDNWQETAAQFARNEDFYRGIVTEIGEMFGIAARISDNGSIQQDVLALKVPELVGHLFGKLHSAESTLARAGCRHTSLTPEEIARFLTFPPEDATDNLSPVK